MSLTILTAVAAMAVVAWRFPAISLAAAVAAFAWSSADLQRTYIAPGTKARAAQDDIVDAIKLVRKLPGVNASCIAWEPDTAIDYNLYNDRFLLPSQRFEELEVPGQTPCGPLIVTPRSSITDRFPGARVITGESFVNERLWAVPRQGDATFATLEGRGFLAPPSPAGNASTPLPPADLQGARITPARSTVIIAAGRTAALPVTVAHAPGGAPWPSVGALASGSGDDAVRVSVQWTSGPGTTAVAELPATLLPGQRVTIRLPLTAVDGNGSPLAPGTYTVRLTVFQAGVGTFTDPPVNLTVTVT